MGKRGKTLEKGKNFLYTGTVSDSGQRFAAKSPKGLRLCEKIM
jgi:hypothetical protein